MTERAPVMGFDQSLCQPDLRHPSPPQQKQQQSQLSLLLPSSTALKAVPQRTTRILIDGKESYEMG